MSGRNGAGREEQNHFGSGWRFVFSDVHPSGQSFATLQNPAGTYIRRIDPGGRQLKMIHTHFPIGFLLLVESRVEQQAAL
jgi:hypothetical protein